MGARITAVEARILSLRLEEPVRTAIHDAGAMDHVLVRVHAEGGLTGCGHAFAFGTAWARAIAAMVEALSSVAVGADAAEPTALHSRLLGSIRFIGLKGGGQIAVSAIDTACWDIAGQLADEPLWALLGGKRRSMQCYASDTLWLGDPVDELGKKAKMRMEGGFEAIKVRIGSGDIEKDLARVEAVREAIGPGATLMADANQGWDRAHAIEAGQRLKKEGLHWLEEPVPAEDYDSLEPIREATGQRIATGESWFGFLDAKPGLDTGAIDVFMPDLERMGGVTGWMDAARAGEDAGCQVSPHLFPEVSIHLMCALEADGLIEYVPWYTKLFDDPPLPKDGRLEPPDRPGLGLKFRDGLFPAAS